MSLNFLAHYGIPEMKWGVRKYQLAGSSKRTPEGKIRYAHPKNTSHASPQSLSKAMTKVKYKNFTKLMSHDDVKDKKSGSCHDQVMYEMAELRKMGLNPKGIFVMEVDDNGQGGMTHSLVYYKNGNKISWLENAWSERAGISDYDSLKSIKREIQKAHESGEFGEKSKYNNLVFGTFNDEDHHAGESLQELVDICLK